MNSTGRNSLESRDADSQSEGCEFKSGKGLNIFSKTRLLVTVSFQVNIYCLYISQLQILSGGLIEMISY